MFVYSYSIKGCITTQYSKLVSLVHPSPFGAFTRVAIVATKSVLGFLFVVVGIFVPDPVRGSQTGFTLDLTVAVVVVVHKGTVVAVAVHFCESTIGCCIFCESTIGCCIRIVVVVIIVRACDELCGHWGSILLVGSSLSFRRPPSHICLVAGSLPSLRRWNRIGLLCLVSGPLIFLRRGSGDFEIGVGNALDNLACCRHHGIEHTLAVIAQGLTQHRRTRTWPFALGARFGFPSDAIIHGHISADRSILLLQIDDLPSDAMLAETLAPEVALPPDPDQ